MFKVLKEMVGENIRGKQSDMEIKIGGRVRSRKAKEAVGQQLKNGLQDLEALPEIDLATGEIKAKKQKKSKKALTAEERGVKDCKTLINKLLAQTCAEWSWR